MKKSIIKVVSVIIVCVLILAACKPAQPDIIDPENKPLPGKYIVTSGASEYRIITPDTPSTIEKEAAETFSGYFETATGIKLIIETASEYSSTNKYIAIGETPVASAAAVGVTAKLATQGFRLCRVGDNVVVMGYGEYGTLWGSQELLTRLFNFEYFGPTNIRINKAVTQVPLYDFNITDIPDIEFRSTAAAQSYYDTSIAHGFRFMRSHTEIFLNPGATFHNDKFFVMDEKGNLDSKFISTDGEQLCYTARGDSQKYEKMQQMALNKLIKISDENPNIKSVTFTIEDNHGECKCSACLAAVRDYGALSATVIRFMNDLHSRFVQHYTELGIEREVTIVFFAYLKYEDAPVKINAKGEYEPTDPSVICSDGVAVFYAPMYANYNYGLKHDINSYYYTVLKKWDVLSKEIYFWTYAINFRNYLVPYNSFDSAQDNYLLLKNTGVKYIFDQHAYDSGRTTGFGSLREYISSKLGWNANANMNKLISDYFDYCFGDASGEMLDYFTQLRIRFIHNQSVLNMPGGIFDEMLKTEYWDSGTLLSWMDNISKAYSAIEPLKTANPTEYQRIYNNICVESLSLRYIWLKLYAPDDAVKTALDKKDFLNDCRKYGITRLQENVNVDTAFS